jgi:hypothetical protein
MGVPGRSGAKERSALHPTVLVAMWTESRDSFHFWSGGVVDCFGLRRSWGLRGKVWDSAKVEQSLFSAA